VFGGLSVCLNLINIFPLQLYLTREREQRSMAATVEQAAPSALTVQIGPTDEAEVRYRRG